MYECVEFLSNRTISYTFQDLQSTVKLKTESTFIKDKFRRLTVLAQTCSFEIGTVVGETGALLFFLLTGCCPSFFMIIYVFRLFRMK